MVTIHCQDISQKMSQRSLNFVQSRMSNVKQDLVTILKYLRLPSVFIVVPVVQYFLYCVLYFVVFSHCFVSLFPSLNVLYVPFVSLMGKYFLNFLKRVYLPKYACKIRIFTKFAMALIYQISNQVNVRPSTMSKPKQFALKKISLCALI